jgi:hypothetical protein
MARSCHFLLLGQRWNFRQRLNWTLGRDAEGARMEHRLGKFLENPAGS